MKTFPIRRADGFLHAFEIRNAFISMRAIKLTLRACGAVSFKRQFFSDDRLVFMFSGEPWVVHEPYGDNSRYWIGPQDASNHCLDVVPIHDAFVEYESPAVRLWSAICKRT